MRIPSTSGAVPVLLGLVAYVVGRTLDGPLGGFLIGAAIALLLLGVYLISAAVRRRRRGWLPSRDGDGRD
ncbi:hypothetical protein [Nocardioides sp.]|uniref:hypothetical protein n=1 Tax=Nocardioides sp. TaxID=35761 RepID=UPI0039E707CA